MLIYPPVTFSPQSMKQCHPPLGLAYIAAVLREEAELCVLDAAVEGWRREERAGGELLRYGLSFDEIEKRIREFKPDLVGMSCIFSSQFRNVAELARRIKGIDPDILTITGGTHPSFLAEACLRRCPELDLIGRGEGEFIMRDLVRFSRQGRDFSQIPGLAWRKEGGIALNPDRTPYPELDEIPFPARDLFPLELYDRISVPMGMVYQGRPFMNLITSRGCPHRCAFCSSTVFWGNCYRKRSIENVLEEMAHLHFELGVKDFKFFDDNLTSDRKRAKSLFSGMIERSIKAGWNTPNGVHVVNMDDELLDLMKASGCYELTLAIESGDPQVLREIIRKPTRLDQIEDAARRIKQRGIGTNAFVIIGFPGETKEQVLRTLKFMSKIDVDRVSLFTFTPLPGTPLFDECAKKGYIRSDEFNEDVDYFEAPFSTPEWSREWIDSTRRRWFWRYNLSLLARHPLRFFSRYLNILKRPRMVFDILRRILIR